MEDENKETKKWKTSKQSNRWKYVEKKFRWTKISSINEFSKDNVEHNKNDIHYVGKQDEDVKEYTDGDEDDEE